MIWARDAFEDERGDVKHNQAVSPRWCRYSSAHERKTMVGSDCVIVIEVRCVVQGLCDLDPSGGSCFVYQARQGSRWNTANPTQNVTGSSALRGNHDADPILQRPTRKCEDSSSTAYQSVRLQRERLSWNSRGTKRREELATSGFRRAYALIRTRTAAAEDSTRIWTRIPKVSLYSTRSRVLKPQRLSEGHTGGCSDS
jgi:hypothetical protein